MSTSPKGSLPYGWIVRASKQYPDRVYYFNTFTGASTWECPVLDPPRLIEEKGSPSEDAQPSDVPSTKNNPPPPVQTTPSPPKPSSTAVVNDAQTTEADVQKESPKLGKRVRKRKAKLLAAAESSEDSANSPPTAVVAPVVLDKSGDNQCTRVIYKKGKKQVVTVPPPANSSFLKGTQPARSPQKSFKKPALMVSVSEGADKKVTFSKDSAHVSTSFEGESVFNDLEMEDSSTFRLSGNESMSDDIEMLDVSADLTKIDDLAVPLQTAKDLCSYYIVIDTNVLIEDLKKISKIKDTSLGNCGLPHIFIPWIVIQELDSLKKSTKACGTGRAAQQAVRYLNGVLKSKHPRFHGQSPQEARDCAKPYSQCNDDKILECCMSLATKMPAEKVVLITHDKNLVNKALICGIHTHNTWESLMEAVQPKSLNGGSSDSSKSKKKKKKSAKNVLHNQNTQLVPLPSAMPLFAPEILTDGYREIPDCPNGYEMEIYVIMCEARQLLKKILEAFLAKEMDDAYGSAWHAIKIDKHLLSGILEAISKYWPKVFANNFLEKDRRNFELLREKVNRIEGFCGDREDCLNTLTAIEDIFCHIKRRWPQLVVPVDKVEDLRAKCNNSFSKLSNLDVTVSPQSHTESSPEPESDQSESKSVLQAFENAWTVINHLCGMTMDFYHIPHGFFYEKPDFVPADKEFRHLMTNLYPSVLNIKKLMLGVVAAVKNHNPRRGIFKELYTALVELVPTLQIQVNNPSVKNFTPEALESYCRNPENTERVQLGCKQIEHFFEKLDEAVKVMSSSIKKEPDQMALG